MLAGFEAEDSRFQPHEVRRTKTDLASQMTGGNLKLKVQCSKLQCLILDLLHSVLPALEALFCTTWQSKVCEWVYKPGTALQLQKLMHHHWDCTVFASLQTSITQPAKQQQSYPCKVRGKVDTQSLILSSPHCFILEALQLVTLMHGGHTKITITRLPRHKRGCCSYHVHL